MKVTVLLLTLVCAVTLASNNLAAAPPVFDKRASAFVSPPSIDAITIPQMLSYQGKLTDTFGLPVADTLYAVRFRLYAQPTGGTQFWEENQQVRTRGGLFSILLGSVTPISSMPDAGAAYLGMAVAGGAEMTPRLRLASSAYAYLSGRAATADLLQGKDTTALDSRYVNEGQASSVTSDMVVDGTIAAADLGQMGASSGQVMKWTGSAWAPRNDSVGSGGGTVTGVSQAIGVVCTPNPITTTGTVRFDSTWGDARYVNEAQSNSVTGAMIADGQVSSADIRDTTVNTADIKDAAVTAPKLNQMGATTDQVLKWTGSAWAPRSDSVGGAGDDAWVRGTPDSVLYTVRQLGIARGGSANMLYGNLRQTHTNLGVACTTGTSGQNYRYSTVGGGCANTASQDYATVSGGYLGTASGSWSTVSGGYLGTASGASSTVGGGYASTASGYIATVGGGWGNVASGYIATLAGGRGNQAGGDYSTVAGGMHDSAKATYGGVLSGYSNLAGTTVADTAAVVCGGYDNSARGPFASVGGGFQNTASGHHATVAGGGDNTASGVVASVGGGGGNTASGGIATVGGGQDNTASGDVATVGGGGGNQASGSYAAVGGGYQNTTPNFYATVGGGGNNAASGFAATVAGGEMNASAANYSFTTNSYSVVPSNFDNSAAFNGQRATASNQTRVGVLSKASGTFTIDHPLDPSGKILNHYFIEGPEMLNIYRGGVALDASGRAEVQLPDYFDALNRNPMVQLTGVGGPDVVYVAEDVSGNRFTIGGKPGTKVYWTVTGERQDVSAEITRRLMPVEQPKTGVLAGTMLDDDFLRGAMDQLVREGRAQGIDFRTAAGRQRYEKMKQHLREAGKR